MFEIIGFIPTSIIFLLLGLYFIHRYRGITYSTYLTTYNSFNIEIGINGYPMINYYLFILYQIIYTLIMGTSYSLCFNMIQHIVEKDSSPLNIIILLLSALANSYITNIYLYKIGYLYDAYQNELNIKHNNIQMMFVNFYHIFNAIMGIGIGSIASLLVCIYNSDIAIAMGTYLGICLGSVLIRHFIDDIKDTNIFGTIERVYCWTLYYGNLIYGLKTFDTSIYLFSLIIISFWGFQFVYNNYNMTLQHINTISICQPHPTIINRSQSKSDTNSKINVEFNDVFRFIKNDGDICDGFKRIAFLFKLNIQKNKFITRSLESLYNHQCLFKIDDYKPSEFLSTLYNSDN